MLSGGALVRTWQACVARPPAPPPPAPALLLLCSTHAALLLNTRAAPYLPPCSAGCNCHSRTDPVCTRAGLIYSSACEAACARQSVRWTCRGHLDCASDCTAAAACKANCDQRLITPVCTKGGVVFSNSCLAVRRSYCFG